MRKVEMSAAGLALLLSRAESSLELWEIVWSGTGETPNAHYRDLAEASREARDRLGLPPREPRQPRPRSEPVPPSADLHALRTDAKRAIEQAMAIEDRYPGAVITDPADAAELRRLVDEVIAMETRIEEIEERQRRRARLYEPTYCPIGRPGAERILFTPRDEGC
jgi:hypothetical protein